MWNDSFTASGNREHLASNGIDVKKSRDGHIRIISPLYLILKSKDRNTLRFLMGCGIARIQFPLYKWKAEYAYGTSNMSAGVGAELLPKSSEQQTVSTPGPLFFITNRV